MSSYEQDDDDDHLPALPPAPPAFAHGRTLSTHSISSSASSSPSASPTNSPSRSPGLGTVRRSDSLRSQAGERLFGERGSPPLRGGDSSSSRASSTSPTGRRKPTLNGVAGASASSASSSPTSPRLARGTSLLAKVSPALAHSRYGSGSVASVGLRSPGFTPSVRSSNSSDRERNREVLREDERRRTLSQAERPQAELNTPLGLGIGGFAKGLGNLPSPPTTASDGGSLGKADGGIPPLGAIGAPGSPQRPERPPKSEARTTPTRRTTSGGADLTPGRSRPSLDERRSSSLVSSELVAQATATNTSETSGASARRNSASSPLQTTLSSTSQRRTSIGSLSFSPTQGAPLRASSPLATSSRGNSPNHRRNSSPLSSPRQNLNLGSPVSRSREASEETELGVGSTAEDFERRRERRAQRASELRLKNQRILDNINALGERVDSSSQDGAHELDTNTALSTDTPTGARQLNHQSSASTIHVDDQASGTPSLDQRSPSAVSQWRNETLTSPTTGRSTPRRSEILQRTLRLSRSTADELNSGADAPSPSGSLSRRSSAMGLSPELERSESPFERENRVRTLAHGSSSPYEGGTPRRRASEIIAERSPRSYTSLGSYPVSPEARRAAREEAHEIERPVSSFGETGDRDEQLAGHLRKVASRDKALSPRAQSAARRAERIHSLAQPPQGGLDLLAEGATLPDSPALAGATSSPAMRSARPGLPKEFLARHGSPGQWSESGSPRLTNLHTRLSLDGGSPRALTSPRVDSARARSPLASTGAFEDLTQPRGARGLGSGESASSPDEARDKTLRAVNALLASAGMVATDLAPIGAHAPPKPPRSAPPAAMHSPNRSGSSDLSGGRTSVLGDWTSPRLRRLSQIDRSDSPTFSRASTAMGSRASGVLAAGASSEHGRMLLQAYEYFEQHFVPLEGGPAAPESNELVRRMGALLGSTTKLNSSLRGLLSSTQEAQVAAELDDRSTTPTASGSALTQFDKSVHALLRVSDDQQRSLTEALLAFTRVERERDKLRREGELGATSGGYSRPASRASGGRTPNLSGLITSPPKRTSTSSSPFEAGNGFSVVRPVASRQALRDPMEVEDHPRRASTISFASARSAYVGGGGTDSPTPMGRRSEWSSQRSPLTDEFATPDAARARATAMRRQGSQATSEVSSSGAGVFNEHGLPAESSQARRAGPGRVKKSSANSVGTVRPITPGQNSIKFPTTSTSAAHRSPTSLATSRARTLSMASLTSATTQGTISSRRRRSEDPVEMEGVTDEEREVYHPARQGLGSSPETERVQAEISSPAEGLAGVGEALRSMVSTGGSAAIQRTRSSGGGTASPVEVRREERRREREDILRRAEAALGGMQGTQGPRR